jgi:hypothetical protein
LLLDINNNNNNNNNNNPLTVQLRHNIFRTIYFNLLTQLQRSDSNNENTSEVVQQQMTKVCEEVFGQRDKEVIEVVRGGSARDDANELLSVAQRYVNNHRDEQQEYETVATIFADLVNALVVSTIDRFVTATTTTTISNTSEEVAVYLKVLAKMMEISDQLYLHLLGSVNMGTPGTTTSEAVAPILYNGQKSKPKQLELLYAVSLAHIMQYYPQSLLPADLGSESGMEGESGGSLESQSMMKALARLQFLCSINEQKRGVLEQKVVRDLYLGGGGGAGGGGMTDMFQKLIGGNNNNNNTPNMNMDQNKALEDMFSMLNSQGGSGSNNNNLNDEIANMSPEEMSRAAAESVVGLKAALASGSLTAAEVAEFEKVVGADIGQVAGMLKMARRDSRLQKELSQQLGANLEDLEDLFEQLARIKKQQ